MLQSQKVLKKGIGNSKYCFFDATCTEEENTDTLEKNAVWRVHMEKSSTAFS